MRTMSSALSSLCVLSMCLGAMQACGSDSSAPGKGNPGKGDAGTDASVGDASASCGDGKVSSGESCDTAIAGGKPGACPSSATCDDGDSCTKDSVKGDGTCTAACAPATAVAANGAAKDGCCPAGATATTDADCSADCGNGKVDAKETCDTAIKSGAGVCKTSCPAETDPCKKVALVTADPCNPMCNTTTITTAKNGDGCCPSGATLTSDDDCTAVCGNGVVESGEDCEGTSATCAACKFVPTALRMTALTLIDPHTYYESGTDCLDITDPLNGLIASKFADDSNGPDGGGDGTIDLSFVLVFRPLDESTASGKGEFDQPDCVATFPPTSCSPSATMPAQPLTYHNKTTGTCLDVDPANLTATYAVPSPATAGTSGCFFSDEATVKLPLAGVVLQFDHARIAAQWVGDPATGLVEGLFTGFLSEATAASLILPAATPIVGGQPLSMLFPVPTNTVCTGIDDRDTGPDGTTRGWWWHLNFTASAVPWVE